MEENEIAYYKQLNSGRSIDSARFQTSVKDTDLPECTAPGRVQRKNITKHSKRKAALPLQILNNNIELQTRLRLAGSMNKESGKTFAA